MTVDFFSVGVHRKFDVTFWNKEIAVDSLCHTDVWMCLFHTHRYTHLQRVCECWIVQNSVNIPTLFFCNEVSLSERFLNYDWKESDIGNFHFSRVKIVFHGIENVNKMYFEYCQSTEPCAWMEFHALSRGDIAVYELHIIVFTSCLCLLMKDSKFDAPNVRTFSRISM